MMSNADLCHLLPVIPPHVCGAEWPQGMESLEKQEVTIAPLIEQIHNQVLHGETVRTVVAHFMEYGASSQFYCITVFFYY